MTTVEMPPFETLEECGIECLEQITESGWGQPSRLYGVFSQEHTILNCQLPLPEADENIRFGRFVMALAHKMIDKVPPFDEIAVCMVKDHAVAFMAYTEIAINTTMDPNEFAVQHRVRTSEMDGSFRCRLMVGTDLTGRTYRAIQREGDETAYNIRGQFIEAGLLPIAMNLLTLAIANLTPWCKPEWIAGLQSLQVKTPDEFEAHVKAHEFDGKRYLLGRE